MPTNELAAYVLEVALAHSRGAFPYGDHAVRIPWEGSRSKICISVDLISSIEYRHADTFEKLEMEEFVRTKIDGLIDDLKRGSQKFDLDIEFPCIQPRK